MNAKVNSLDKVCTTNRTTVIEIEKTLSSEFSPITKLRILPLHNANQVTNDKQTRPTWQDSIPGYVPSNIQLADTNIKTNDNENRNNTRSNPLKEIRHRDETTPTITKPTLDLLIIGSSIVKFIDAKKIEKHNPESSQTVCIPGGKIPDILKQLDEMKQ